MAERDPRTCTCFGESHGDICGEEEGEGLLEMRLSTLVGGISSPPGAEALEGDVSCAAGAMMGKLSGSSRLLGEREKCM